jgi:flagellar capping protein FliD
MDYGETDSVWSKKGATLSDKSARKEFGLTQEEIVEAIRSEKLQYKQNYMHGNPYFRLLRSEVESLVNEKYGEDYLKTKKLKNELSQVNKEIRRLKKQLKSLEEKKLELLRNIGE